MTLKQYQYRRPSTIERLHSRGHSFRSIFMKFGQNVCPHGVITLLNLGQVGSKLGQESYL